MAFKRGHNLAKGRPPGSKNKKTDLFAICDDVGLNVFKEMVAIAARTVDDEERFNKLSQIAPYLYAKKKEITNLSDHPLEDLMDAAEQKLNEPERAI